MRQRKTSYPPVNVGSSFMLVILIILSMVIFAVLSLSGALRDARYSQTRAERTTAYYEANNLAEEKLAQIDQILSDTAAEHELFTADYGQTASSLLAQLDGVTVSAMDQYAGVLHIQYTVPLSDTEQLNVMLVANDRDADTDGYYYITQWKQTTTRTWKGDDSLHLLGNDL